MSSNQADIENALNEKTPLLVKTEKININSDRSSPTQNIPNGNTNIQTQSTTGRLVSFCAYSDLIAVHMIGNGLYH